MKNRLLLVHLTTPAELDYLRVAATRNFGL